MTRYSPQIWAAIKTDYCSGARSVPEIEAYYGPRASTIETRCRKEGWQKTTSALPAIPLTVPEREPDGHMSRERFAPRLKNLLERAVAEIELAAAGRTADTTSMDRARDVRTLTTVVRLLDELEHGPLQTEKPNPMEETEHNEHLIRQEIADRLGRLRDAGRTL